MSEPKRETPLETWLSDRPSEFARLLAARSALRLVPLLVESIRSDADSRRFSILLPSFRVLVSASLVAASTDRADGILADASAVGGVVTDVLEKTMYAVRMDTIDLKEIDQPESFPDIHAHEADTKGLQGVKEIMNAARSAVNTSVHHANYTSNIASKHAPISTACATINACFSALYYLYDGQIMIANPDTDPTHSKDDTEKFDLDSFLARHRQETQVLCSIDSDLEDIEDHLSILSVSKDYKAIFSDFKVAIKQDMQVLCSMDADVMDIACCLSVLSQKPLWFDNIPIYISEKWIELKGAMPEGEAWTVWIDWYEAHLKGESRNETLESVLSTIPVEVWKDEVGQVNSYLLEAVQAQWDPMAIALTDGLKEVDAVSDSLDLRQYRSRIMTALTGDPREAVGGTKDLLEAVMKTILDRRGCDLEENISFNTLINTCWSELNLDTQDRPSDKGERLFRKISSQAKKMIEAANELRNIAGSGHGRIVGKEHPLTTEDARMIASIGFVLSGWLVHCEKRLD